MNPIDYALLPRPLVDALKNRGFSFCERELYFWGRTLKGKKLARLARQWSNAQRLSAIYLRTTHYKVFYSYENRCRDAFNRAHDKVARKAIRDKDLSLFLRGMVIHDPDGNPMIRFGASPFFSSWGNSEIFRLVNASLIDTPEKAELFLDALAENFSPLWQKDFWGEIWGVWRFVEINEKGETLENFQK